MQILYSCLDCHRRVGVTLHKGESIHEVVCADTHKQSIHDGFGKIVGSFGFTFSIQQGIQS